MTITLGFWIVPTIIWIGFCLWCIFKEYKQAQQPRGDFNFFIPVYSVIGIPVATVIYLLYWIVRLYL